MTSGHFAAAAATAAGHCHCGQNASSDHLTVLINVDDHSPAAVVQLLSVVNVSSY